jgi:signal transduction histidine kinase
MSLASVGLPTVDLAQDIQATIGRRQPVRRELQSSDGKPWLIWVRESGVREFAVTAVDVLALRKSDDRPRSGTQSLSSSEQGRRLQDHTLEDEIGQRTKWLTLLHDVTLAVNSAATWDDALRLVLRHICRTEGWQIGYVYLPDRERPDELVLAIDCVTSDHFTPFHDASKRMRYARGQSLPGRVFATGAPVWTDGQDDLLSLMPFRADSAKHVGLRAGAALPVTLGAETIAVLEIFSDHSHRPSDDLMNLMTDVGAQISHVIERERLVSQAAEAVWREQQEMIHTLHDTLGQELTAVGMLSASLVQRFKASDQEAAGTAQQIAATAQRALESVRQLSRGLFPVDVDAGGLLLALRQLASTTESVHKIRCRLEADPPVLVSNNHVATHLYRIAQEAVTNAVKHARAGEIRIGLSAVGGTVTLTVSDDGLGIQPVRSDGVGLRIMRYRAWAIGASLAIESGLERGTVVRCTLRHAPSPRSQHAD